MDALVVWAAQDLLFLLLGIVAGLTLAVQPLLRWRTVAAAALGLALVGVLIAAAAALHTDPRPFVTDPALRPLFPHPADNGFPSDHCAAAGLLTTIAWRLRAAAGVTVGVGAVLIAAARVAAGVHHVQDVTAGLLLGALAGLAALAVADGLSSLIARVTRTSGRAR